MSKCPDAEDGEAAIAQVMEKVGNKVSLNFTYIAMYLQVILVLTLGLKILLMAWG